MRSGTPSPGVSRPLPTRAAAEPLRQFFAEYEEIVEGQTFSLLDAIEDRIDALALRVLFDTGETAPVAGLQAYPSTNAVSFPAPAHPPTPGVRAEVIAAAPVHQDP